MQKRGNTASLRKFRLQRSLHYTTSDEANDEENMNERVHKIQSGQCEKGICGDEAACKQHPNNTFVCLCPHDMQPPTKDGRCPTRKTVPLDPRKIENILPPTNNETKAKTNETQRIHNHHVTTIPSSATTISTANAQIPNTAVYAASIVGLLAILITIGIVWRRARHCKNRNKNSSSPERYAPNPQYSVCTNNGVQLLLKEHISFLVEIGEGCFGKVYKGVLRNEHNDNMEIVAVKVLKESASREAEEDFLREVDIMSAFRHENILSLIGVVQRDANISPMMVFEFMPHGDLAEVLRNQNKRFSDEKDVLLLSRNDLLYIALQIANGMMYLASQRFVHRDLACRNCLVTDGPTVKIADFGMSRDVYTCDYYKVGGSRLLPVRWMSPESVVYGRFTLESDIWSFGIVLWEIYTYAKQPYYGHTNDEVVKLILQGIMLIPPDDCPNVICELMRNCWKTEPRDRIKFTGIYDMLAVAYEETQSPTTVVVEQTNTPPTSSTSTMSSTTSQVRTMTLPRPPPLLRVQRNMLQPIEDLVDADGYLLPKDIKEPVQYLETLPD